MSSWKRLAIRLDSYFGPYLSTYTNRLFLAALMSPTIGASIAHLPTKKHTYTIIKGPHVDKESREVWELAIHRKLLTIDGPNDSVRRFRAYIEQEERSIYSSVRVAVSMKESTFIPLERKAEKREYKLEDFLFAPFAPAHRALPRSTQHPDLLYLDPTKVVRQALTEEEYSLTEEDKQEALRLGQPIDSEPKRPPTGLTRAQWEAYEPLLKRQPGEHRSTWVLRNNLGPGGADLDLSQARKTAELEQKFENQMVEMRDRYLGQVTSLEKQGVIDALEFFDDPRGFEGHQGPGIDPEVADFPEDAPDEIEP